MILDVLLLVLIAGVIIVAAAQGLLRALVMALILYLLSLILGALVLSAGIANALNDVLIGSLGATERTPLFYQAIFFVGLLIPGFIGGVALTHVALEDTSIPALRWGDNVLGTIVGAFVGLTLAALICNAWGVMVSETWRPVHAWYNMRIAFDSSALRPAMMDALRVYRRLLFPFTAARFPIFFNPQAWLTWLF